MCTQTVSENIKFLPPHPFMLTTANNKMSNINKNMQHSAHDHTETHKW